MRNLMLFGLLALLAAIAPACDSTKESPTSQAMVSPGALPLCTACGQIKGTDKCCDPANPDCASCGLDKGSPGCCRITKGSDENVALCVKCGQFAGSKACCDPSNPDCAGCGMDKGSPGCCKME